MELRLRVPASTSNLGPGFDALGLALTLYNRVSVRTRPEPGCRIAVRGMGEGVLPEGPANLFYASAKAAACRAGATLPGLEVEMVNAIPIARGLGSSSTAIVAGVVTGNLLCGGRLSDAEVLDLSAGLEGHPDNVSACLKGGLTVSSFSDGRVECIRALPPPELGAVVAVPDFELETRTARAALPAHVPHRDAVFNVGRACLVTAALLHGDLTTLRAAMQDRLHQPYRAPLIRGFDRVSEAADRAGALGVCLSGAGPSLLALTEGAAEAVGAAMVAAWQKEGVAARALTLKIDCEGVTEG